MDSLRITIQRNGVIFGVDICGSCEMDLREKPFEDFARQYLEPAFEQLKNEMDNQDGLLPKDRATPEQIDVMIKEAERGI